MEHRGPGGAAAGGGGRPGCGAGAGPRCAVVVSELEVRLQQWRAVRAWLGWQQRQADQAIRDLEAQLAAAASPRPGPRQPASRRPPPPTVVVALPEWKVTSMRTADGPKPLTVHVGDCTMDDGKPISRDEARRLIAEGVEPWTAGWYADVRQVGPLGAKW